MSRRSKILGGIVGVLAVCAVAFGLVLSHDSSCEAPPPPGTGVNLMKAIVYRCYGGPEVLKLEDVPVPTPADGEVLVRVRAASVNPLDWHYMRGKPYFMRLSSGIGKPKVTRFGVDFAGTVEAVGKNVTRFHVGDEVFGGRTGALAQFVVVREDRGLSIKPENMSFEQAAAMPIAGITALQALRDKGKLKPGQNVLVNGASGGVGTFAVQIAKAAGADVTGVCSTKNVALVRSLGAHQVIDYKTEDFTKGSQKYDIIVDNVGNYPLLAYRRVLKPEGIVVMVGGPTENPWLGPLGRVLMAAALSPFVSQQYLMFLAELNGKDLGILRNMVEGHSVKSVIDRRYPLAETPAAIAYLEEGRARGKVVIDVE
jgi:NADPH:quinone reductase-like Zn-dependent oxidoreductase